MITHCHIVILSFCLGVLAIANLNAQSYLKKLSNPERSIRQKITTFPNGDLLIGDSAPQELGERGTAAIFLTRMDPCGAVIWSHAFEKKNIQLEFRDFTVNDQGQILVFGSYIDGLRETVFLLEVSGEGEKGRFARFDTDQPSNSSFSMVLRNDRILIFGRLLEIGAPTTGFLAVLDMKLNLQWGKKIRPFAYEGSAILTEDGEIAARSRALHYQFDGAGNLQWIKEFERALAPEPIAGPIEVTGGYLYEAFSKGEAFFYKLDRNGELRWKSAIFSSTVFPAAVQEMPDGKLIAHYSAPETTGNTLHQLTLAPSGHILQHKKLQSDFSFNVGSVFHSFRPNGMINIIGNKDVLQATPADISDYLLQFSRQMPTTGCFDWIDTEATNPNEHMLTFPDPAAAIFDLDLQASEPGGLQTYPSETPFREVCGATAEPTLMKVDTLIGCQENWRIKLPGTDFSWEDSYPDSERLLETPGTYRARNRDCAAPVLYEFSLERAICDCRVYLPNAFSPNGDGQNDVLELLTGCQITAVETSVFDRWGNLVHRSQTSGRLWDGTTRQQPAAEGVYVFVVSYNLLTGSGNQQPGTLTGEVLLIR